LSLSAPGQGLPLAAGPPWRLHSAPAYLAVHGSFALEPQLGGTSPCLRGRLAGRQGPALARQLDAEREAAMALLAVQLAPLRQALMQPPTPQERRP